MTESSEDKKERNTLDELQKIGPLILNCHRSERQRQNRAALELKAFCKFLANSYADGRKGANEMEEALRYVPYIYFLFLLDCQNLCQRIEAFIFSLLEHWLSWCRDSFNSVSSGMLST